jgi:hypothetical protein
MAEKVAYEVQRGGEIVEKCILDMPHGTSAVDVEVDDLCLRRVVTGSAGFNSGGRAPGSLPVSLGRGASLATGASWEGSDCGSETSA